MSTARSQQKRKEQKRKKRQGKSFQNGASAKSQLKQALAAVQQLKELEGLGALGPAIQAIHEEVARLGPLLDAVVEDNQTLADEQAVLVEAVAALYALVPGVSEELRTKLQGIEAPRDEDETT